MGMQQIAPLPDFDTTSEQFGEAGGHDPDDLIRAKQAADRLSAELGQPIEPSWLLKTKWLLQLTLTHRVRARQALRWRPRFLSALSASCSFVRAAKAAKISYNTFKLHQKNDPEFARQVAEAEEQAVELLHAQCFKAALEGILEPVYFEGKIVGHTRKFESRMAIELLRAHMPNTFRRPGAKVNVSPSNPAPFGSGVSAKALQELIEMRKRSLALIQEKMAKGQQVPPASAVGPPKG
jgi:hypothetical protein